MRNKLFNFPQQTHNLRLENVKKIFKFASEVKGEATKVTWPSFKDTRGMTIMVVLLVTFFSIYLWIADWALSGAVRFVTSF